MRNSGIQEFDNSSIPCPPSLAQARRAGRARRPGRGGRAQSLNSLIEISVADTGIGIATEDQKKIFDDFYQAKGGIKDKTPGTGLGLSLSKSLVEMHKGRIWAESEGEGKGSRFSFVLPTKPWQLEEGWPEAIKDRMASHEILLDH